MKAEHRKELETNILADKMGRIISGAKTGPTRGLLFYVIIGLFALVALFLVYRYFAFSRTKASDTWRNFEDGTAETINALYQSGGKTNASKAAELQLAWEALWYQGLKQLGKQPQQALKNIEDAQSVYKKIAESCKGDPVFEPEALYALAVIEETLLLKRENREGLERVKDKYKAVVTANKDSSFAEWANKRLEDLNKDEGRDVLTFYQNLDIVLSRRVGLPPDFGDLQKLLQQHQQRKQ